MYDTTVFTSTALHCTSHKKIELDIKYYCKINKSAVQYHTHVNFNKIQFFYGRINKEHHSPKAREYRTVHKK